MTVVAAICIVMVVVLRPKDVKKEVLQKAGSNILYQLDFASKQILAKNTVNYSLKYLKADDGSEFDITSDDAEQKLISIYKKYLKGLNKKSLSSEYLSKVLVDENNMALTGISANSFNYGFFLNNNAYIAIKLNKNCTTHETYIYSPIQIQKRERNNSCGLFFFDVNGDMLPNKLGVDQYIVSIGEMGIK